jgi:hypothetical protein
MKMYADMLADPCNATLVPGLHSSDEGILARLKTIINVSSGNENGYLMWCPAYCGSRASDKIQFVVFTNSASNVGPLNTVAEPAFNGSNYSDTQGASDTVGAETFVQSATVSDFRLVSSCINLKYTGAMSASKGVIGYLENVPADTVLVGNAGNPATIDQIFNLTSHTARLGVNDHEIKYRPNATISGTFKSDRDSVYTKGVNGVSQTAFTSESLRFSPTFYGFAWKGVISSDMLFDVYQNIEWRPEAASGYVATVPKQLNAPGYLDMVKKYLDDNYPGWTTKAMNGAAYGAGRLASIALSGSFAPPSIRWRG